MKRPDVSQRNRENNAKRNAKRTGKVTFISPTGERKLIEPWLAPADWVPINSRSVKRCPFTGAWVRKQKRKPVFTSRDERPDWGKGW